jgi:dihydroorotate dehydrogenase electron transfer subunit
MVEKMYQVSTKVLWNKTVGPAYFKLGLTCSEHYSTAKPGQFVMLRVGDRLSPLLRRPFSIHNVILNAGKVNGIEILYKVVGEGTELLSKCRTNDMLSILGPLGNGFLIPEACHRISIVAGGIGVAPMVFLASDLVKTGIDPGQCTVFIGGRSSDDLLCQDEFWSLGMKVRMTTDDGSAGDQCLVTHPFELAVKQEKPDMIYACGPLQMLQCIAAVAENFNLPCQISIEALMACGMGACLGCAVKPRGDKDKYLHACIDGPVFNSKAIQI